MRANYLTKEKCNLNNEQPSGHTLPWFLTSRGEDVYNIDDYEYLVLDFETTSLDNGSPLNEENEMVLAGWYICKGHRVLEAKHCFATELNQRELLQDIKRVRFVVAQNAKFELAWLKRCGLELRDVIVFDTMLAEWVLGGNLRTPKSLTALCARYGVPPKLDNVSRLISAGVCPSDIPPDWLLRYNMRDVEACWRVFLKQYDLLWEKALWHLILVRNLTCAMLADIEFNGMTLDPEAVQAEYLKTYDELNECKSRLERIADGVNLNSKKQLAELLYDRMGFKEVCGPDGKPRRTAGGARQVTSDIVARLRPSTEEQQEFLEYYTRYNKLSSLLSKNLIFFKKVCDERGGTFHGVFNQGITKTHRLSSSGRPLIFKDEKKSKSVQFQNMPRDYKRLFWSGDEDWLIAESDGAQLEFRVAADLGRDEVAIKEITEEVDVHTVTAETLTAAGEPTSRQQAKSRTFRPLYGGSTGTPAEVAYCEFFKKKYKGISDTQHGWTLKVADKKKLRTPYGMIFYWPDAKMHRSGYVSYSTEIYNFPVQGLATAEIIPIAAVHFWHRSRDLPMVMLNTIHDSIVNRIHKSVVKEYEAIVKVCFTDDVYRFLREVYDYEFVAPLGVGIKCSRNWGTGKDEIIYNCFPDGSFKRKVK